MNVNFSNQTQVGQTGTISIDVRPYYAYCVLGSVAVLTNVFIFLVLVSDGKLLKQSAFFVGVTGSHLLCGLAITTTGVFRVVTDGMGRSFSAWYCAEMIFPLLQPLAFETMSHMLIVVGVERLLAAVAPTWFRNNWTNKRAWITVSASYIIAFLTIIYGTVQAWRTSQNATRPALSCALPSVVGIGLVLWNFGSTVIGGTIAVVLTLIAFIACMKRISKLSLLSGDLGRAKKQMQLTKAMLSISTIDFLLVVIPTFVSLLAISTTLVSYTWTGVFNNVYCINDTIMSHLIFNSNFRKAAAKLVRLDKCVCKTITNNVLPMASGLCVSQT